MNRLKEFEIGVRVAPAYPSPESEDFSAVVRIYAANHADAVKLVMDELHELRERTVDEFMSDGKSEVHNPKFCPGGPVKAKPITLDDAELREPSTPNPGRPTGTRPLWRRLLNV